MKIIHVQATAEYAPYANMRAGPIRYTWGFPEYGGTLTYSGNVVSFAGSLLRAMKRRLYL